MHAPVPPYFDYLIEAFRHGKAGRDVHLGYWDDPAAPVRPDEFGRAQARLTDVLLGMAALRDGLRLLDAGCGFGGAMDAVNRRHRGMAMTGVNIDPRQLDICGRIAPLNGNRFRWELADACALPFADAAFDRVVCIEAMFHFSSRRRFFAEAARVLKPGGALVVSDIVVLPSARLHETADFRIEAPIVAGYGPWPDFRGTDADHAALARAAGLEPGELRDITANTLPSHRFTAPTSPESALDTAGRAASRLHWLHRNGHLRYLCMRFGKHA